MTNFIILSSRKTPFTAMDFYLIKDAIKVAGLYVSIVQIILIALLVIAVITGLVFLWRKAPKIEVTIKRLSFMHMPESSLCWYFLRPMELVLRFFYRGS